MDCFTTLGLSPTASAAEVRRAYRQRAQWLHPDHRPDDDEAAAGFRALHEAYLQALASARRRDAGGLPAPPTPGFNIARRTYARGKDGAVAWRSDVTGEWTPVTPGVLLFAGHLAGRGAGRIARWWRS